MSIENLENIDICIIVLLVLLILAILIILYLYSKYRKLEAKYNKSKRENYELDILYQDQLRKNNWLNNDIGKKNLEINELNKLVGKDKTSTNDTLPQKNVEPSESSEKDSEAKKKNVEAKEVTMYASFPRSAGSSVYFSDLTLILEDDSFFELKISKDKKMATFRPLDFMKIRNYDPAMIAMQTEGVKPNVASAVLGIENGKAHKEGSDWIIDNPAKIKLA